MAGEQICIIMDNCIVVIIYIIVEIYMWREQWVDIREYVYVRYKGIVIIVCECFVFCSEQFVLRQIDWVEWQVYV